MGMEKLIKDIESDDIATSFGITPERAKAIKEHMMKVEEEYSHDASSTYDGNFVVREFLKGAKNVEEACVMCWRAGVSFQYQLEKTPGELLSRLLSGGNNTESDNEIHNEISDI